MKDFLKWLGVNEKVAKVAIWLFVIMAFLIMTNTLLDSVGLPYYKITADNLVKINTNELLNSLSQWIISLFNFYTIIFLVFRVKDFKKIFPYSILYVLLNCFVMIADNYALLQIYIFLYIVVFCFFYSGKKSKYVLYGICSLIFNTFVQFIWFTYKASSVNINSLDDATKIMLSLDFFIVMVVIIFVKEIYLNKRREKECLEVKAKDQEVGSGWDNSKMKATLPRK